MEKPFYSDSEGESGPTESADSGNFRGLMALFAPSGHYFLLVLTNEECLIYVCESVCMCERERNEKAQGREKVVEVIFPNSQHGLGCSVMLKF